MLTGAFVRLSPPRKPCRNEWLLGLNVTLDWICESQVTPEGLTRKAWWEKPVRLRGIRLNRPGTGGRRDGCAVWKMEGGFQVKGMFQVEGIGALSRVCGVCPRVHLLSVSPQSQLAWGSCGISAATVGSKKGRDQVFLSLTGHLGETACSIHWILWVDPRRESRGGQGCSHMKKATSSFGHVPQVLFSILKLSVCVCVAPQCSLSSDSPLRPQVWIARRALYCASKWLNFLPDTFQSLQPD